MASAFSVALAAVLKEHGLSVREAARLAGIPYATLGMVISSRRTVRLDLVLKIVAALELKRSDARTLASAALSDHGASGIAELL